MTDLTAICNKKVKDKAVKAAEERMPLKWDRNSVTMVNVFNAYLMEAMQSEYTQLIQAANSHGYVQGLQKSLTVTNSLKAFYDDI